MWNAIAWDWFLLINKSFYQAYSMPSALQMLTLFIHVITLLGKPNRSPYFID